MGEQAQDIHTPGTDSLCLPTPNFQFHHCSQDSINVVGHEHEHEHEHGETCIDPEQPPSIPTSVCEQDDEDDYAYDPNPSYFYDSDDESEDEDGDVTLNERSTSSSSYFFKMTPQQQPQEEHNLYEYEYYPYRYQHHRHSNHHVMIIPSPIPYEEEDGDESLSSISISEWGRLRDDTDAGVRARVSFDKDADVYADTTVDKPRHRRFNWRTIRQHKNRLFSPHTNDKIELPPSLTLSSDAENSICTCSTSWGTPTRTTTFPAMPEPFDVENCVFSCLDIFDGLCHKMATCGDGCHEDGTNVSRVKIRTGCNCGCVRNESYHQKQASDCASTHTYIYLPTP